MIHHTFLCSLFVRDDELKHAWKLFDPLLEAIDKKTIPVHIYPRGSRGPPQGDHMVTCFILIHLVWSSCSIGCNQRLYEERKIRLEVNTWTGTRVFSFFGFSPRTSILQINIFAQNLTPFMLWFMSLTLASVRAKQVLQDNRWTWHARNETQTRIYCWQNLQSKATAPTQWNRLHRG